MRTAKRHLFARAFITASTLAIATGSTAVWAQDSQPADGQQTVNASGGSQDSAQSLDGGAIIVTGIRASLRESMNIKRDAQGVVDAISAEDIGKFPDTNLAESLQRITGVSIDRSNGEGQYVTVRGFGPEFNLVLLDGRNMPASNIGDGVSAPASRSFDFSNLAAEGVAAVEVYKSGRASLPTGGIGSVINIKTPRPLDNPGFKGSLSIKGVVDHTFKDTAVTPEVSGIVSDTFADNKIGITLIGSYQKRRADLSQFVAGWREGYLGSENNWGSLAMPGDARYANITNRPGPNDIYQVTQNAGYDFINLKRERINGQAILQFRPVDNLTATVDYVYSQNTVDTRTNSIGVWFNHNDTSSAWTDGPVAGPLFYSENFTAGEAKDLAITGAIAANRNINRSLGGNLKWEGPGGLHLELDAHHSTAESKPTSPYGSNIAVGTAIYGVQTQTVDFTHDLPVISVGMYPGSEIAVSNIRPAGNAFRTAYMRDRINEVSLKGGYDFDASVIESLNFGVTYTDNNVRTAYGVLQNDTWGGTLSAANTPDDLFDSVNLPDNLKGIDGSQDPAIIANYFNIDTPALIGLLENQLGICSAPVVGTPVGGANNCLAQYDIDRRLSEKTIAPYLQANFKFEIGDMLAHLRAGVRYEKTTVDSNAKTKNYTGTSLNSYNEIGVLDDKSAIITSSSSEYHKWLPAVDFDISPVNNVILRASYSHTITRPSYAQLDGGFVVNSPARPGGGSTATTGNTELLPYLSKNIDLSAEWYYGPSSYISVGYFHKTVSDFIGTQTYQSPLFGLTNPGQGAIFQEAVAAMGAGAPFAYGDPNDPNATPGIMNYVLQNYPNAVFYNGSTPFGILGQPGDPLIDFTVSQPGNTDQVAHLSGWEFAIQHSFWNTGFGTILNYTVVNSDTYFDNTLRYTATQFAVTGVSDSANAVLFYDKNGVQARLAYNWRAGFLSGYGFDPFYTEPYGQLDFSASYDITPNVSVVVDGINITNSDRRVHMRDEHNVQYAAPGYARYSAGVRVKF